MRGAVASNQAVHGERGVLAEEFAQEKAPYETVRPGKQDLLEFCR